MKEMVQRENPKVLLIASPNNPTGNGLTPAELDALLAELPVTTIVWWTKPMPLSYLLIRTILKCWLINIPT